MASDGTIEQRGSFVDLLRLPFVWLGIAVAGLACFIYYPFYFPASHMEIAAQSEEFFFEANEAAGAPVLLLAVWLFYRRSHYLDLLRGTSSPVGAAAAFAATFFLFVWGAYTKADDLQLMSSIGLLFGVVLLLGGRAALRAYWLPILFLAFALPLSPVLLSAVIYPIQLATAQYAGFILNGIGVTSYIQGDQILRPENTFVVIETCSGVRTIVTLSMLTILLIDLFERRGWHAAILIGLAPIVAFLSNGFRVVTLVLNPHSSIHSIHNLQGIGMLLVGLTAMYLIDGMLERALGSRDPLVEDGDYGMTRSAPVRDSVMLARLAAIGAVLIGMSVLAASLTPWSYSRGLEEMPDALLARVFGEDRSRRPAPDYQFRGSVRYLAHTTRRVEIEGEYVDIHLGVGDEQMRRHTLLSPRLAWPASGYAAIESGEARIGDRMARRLVLRKGARSVLSYSWYERDRGLFTEWFRQAAALDRSPFVRPEHMLAIRISTNVGPVGSRTAEAEARIAEAWRRLEPELVGYGPTSVGP